MEKGAILNHLAYKSNITPCNCRLRGLVGRYRLTGYGPGNFTHASVIGRQHPLGWVILGARIWSLTVHPQHSAVYLHFLLLGAIGRTSLDFLASAAWGSVLSTVHEANGALRRHIYVFRK